MTTLELAILRHGLEKYKEHMSQKEGAVDPPLVVDACNFLLTFINAQIKHQQGATTS